MLAPDIVVEDHRSLALPGLDGDGLVAMLEVDTDLSPDRVYISRAIHVVGSAVLTTLDGSGTTDAGSAYEWCFHLLNVWNDEGLVHRRELFDEDDFDAALARLDELGAPDRPDSRTHRPENEATRLIQVWADHLRAGRIDEAFAMVRDDGVRVDHRSTVGVPDDARPGGASSRGGDRNRCRVHQRPRDATGGPRRAILPGPNDADDRGR